MTQSPSGGLREVIAAGQEAFEAAFKRGDAAGVAAFYTDNGQALPPNSDFVTGKQAIQGFWQAAMDSGIKAMTLESVEVEGHGDTAIEVGKYTLHDEGGQPLDEGKYIVIYKQEDGEWRLHRDIFNGSMPIPE
jgi:uncharacterized protein (TIGR02246 family)